MALGGTKCIEYCINAQIADILILVMDVNMEVDYMLEINVVSRGSPIIKAICWTCPNLSVGVFTDTLESAVTIADNRGNTHKVTYPGHNVVRMVCFE